MPTSKPFLPERWVELISMDHAYSLLELDRMPDYGFTAATLWTSFEPVGPGQLDNYFYTLPVHYTGRFADLNAMRDQDRIRPAADFLREFSRRAHHHGMKVMHVYHLCNFTGPLLPLAGPSRPDRTTSTAEALRPLRPKWFNEAGEIDLAAADFYEFMAAEVNDFFDTFPHVDGLFCWNCECSTFTPSRMRHQTVSKAEIAARAMNAVYDVCQRRNKLMSHDIHTAGADKELTRGIIAAAGECPDLILGADATYSDWHMHLPTTPWLAEMGRKNRIYVGFDAAGEFFGQGRTIAGWPQWTTKHFNAAKEHKAFSAITVRSSVSSKATCCTLLPMLEFNLRHIATLARDGSADLDQLIAEWWRQHFAGTLPEGMKQIFLSFEEIIGEALYINGTNVTEYYPDHSYSAKAITHTPGFPIWHSEQFDRPGTPIPEVMAVMIPVRGQHVRPVEELRGEKRRAMRLCDDALAKLRSIPLATEDREYFQRRVAQIRDFAEAFLGAINVTYPLYQLVVEHHDKSLTDPKQALRQAITELRALAGAIEQRWGTQFYRRLPEKMRSFADDAATMLA